MMLAFNSEPRDCTPSVSSGPWRPFNWKSLEHSVTDGVVAWQTSITYFSNGDVCSLKFNSIQKHLGNGTKAIISIQTAAVTWASHRQAGLKHSERNLSQSCLILLLGLRERARNARFSTHNLGGWFQRAARPLGDRCHS